MSLSSSITVALSISSFGESDSGPLKALKSSGVEVIENPYKRKLKLDEVRTLVQRADAIIAGTEPLTKEVLESSSRLKVISRVGVGLDNVDLDVAKRRGIEVKITPDAVTDPVAELTLAGILSCLRYLHSVHADLSAGRWNRRMGGLLRHRTVGIVGYGRIGRRLRRLLEPFEVKVLVCEPGLAEDSVTEHRVTPTGLSDLLRESDIVTLHLPGTETPLIASAELDMMPSHALLINTARGGLVDEEALNYALQQEQIAGAYIDTFAEEPYSGILCDAPNVLLTPHIGSYAAEARARMESEAVENLLVALQERTPR